MAVGGCAYTLCAITVILVNILILIISLVFLAAGGVLVAGRPIFDTYVTPMLQSLFSSMPSGMSFDIDAIINGAFDFFRPLAIGILISGIILLVISASGFFGACCKSKCLLVIYVVCVGVIFLTQAILLIVYASDEAGYQNKVKEYMTTSLTTEFTGISNGNFITVVWNIGQASFWCCGVNNGSDYNSATNWNRNYTYSSGGNNVTIYLQYPITCCKMRNFVPIDANCTFDPKPSNSNYETGCYTKVSSLVNQYYSYLLGFIGGLLGLQTFLIICASLMLSHVVSKGRSVQGAAKY